MKVFAKVFLIVIFFPSCTKFITVEPEDGLIREEYWKSETDVMAVISTSYGDMKNLLHLIFYWSEIRGGLISPNKSAGVSDRARKIFNYNILPNHDWVKWGEFYKIINLANTVIKYAPKAQENDNTFSDERLEAYIAEAVFIRSLCYFYLVKAFRDVPLILEPYDSDAEEFNIAKSNEDEIIQQLITDLNKAIPNAFRSSDFNDERYKKGRATVDALNTLLADIYLWNNNFTECIQTCNEILNSFPGQLMQDGENENEKKQSYFSLFGRGNRLESIFELQFGREYNQTNDLFSITANFNDGYKNYVVSDYLIGLYSVNDIRGDGVSYYTGINYSIWKYIGSDAVINNNDKYRAFSSSFSDANWIFYRLSEIYLIMAEAYAEQDMIAEAKIALNKIRIRAGNNEFTGSNDKIDLLTAIMEERAREFIGEGKRWFDIVRVVRRDKIKRLDMLSIPLIANVEVQHRVTTSSKIKDIDGWFLPIHYEELQLNQDLVQNPFYDDFEL